MRLGLAILPEGIRVDGGVGKCRTDRRHGFVHRVLSTEKGKFLQDSWINRTLFKCSNPAIQLLPIVRNAPRIARRRLFYHCTLQRKIFKLCSFKSLQPPGHLRERRFVHQALCVFLESIISNTDVDPLRAGLSWNNAALLRFAALLLTGV